jgi:predicted N-acyltransferase
MTKDATQQQLVVTVRDSLEGLSADQWNTCVQADEPFQEFEFLRALELSGSVGQGTGWIPSYVTLELEDELVGALPMYIKLDSYGEFIFDWAWADAYQRADVAYYPKAVTAIPFTPAAGRRILVAPHLPYERCAELLVAAAIETAKQAELSGVHFLFSTEEEMRFLEERGFMSRLTYQFHWLNRGYAAFDDFAGDLRSSKRKNILKERRRVADADVEVRIVEGDDIRPDHLRRLWRFYTDTIGRKWSYAYLTEEFFERLSTEFRSRLVLVLAERDGEVVAGTLNVRKGTNLYGRYWGCSEEIPGLHFECCYYRLIDYAIENGIETFEAGAQGEHKFLRGFVTRPTYSAHWLAHAGGRDAIGRFLVEERSHTLETIERYNALSPLKYLRAGSG